MKSRVCAIWFGAAVLFGMAAMAEAVPPTGAPANGYRNNNSVPIPATIALLGAGLGGFAAWRAKQGRRNK